MRPFETQSGRNKRLLEETRIYLESRIKELDHESQSNLQWTDLYVFTTVFIICNRAVEVANDYFELLEARYISPFWGRGDRARCLALVLVCACPMLSAWFSEPEPGGRLDRETLRAVKQESFLQLANLAGADAASLRDFLLNIDVQYTRDTSLDDTIERDCYGLTIDYTLLLLAALRQAIENRALINWATQTWPVTKDDDYAFAGSVTFDDLLGTESSTCAGFLTLCDFILSKASQELRMRSKFPSMRRWTEDSLDSEISLRRNRVEHRD